VRRRAIGLPAVAILAIACGSSTPTPSPAAPSAAAPSASASGGPSTTSPSASAAGGALEIRGGDLAPGTYTHSGFEPRIIFEVDEGWQGVQNTSGFFDIQQDPDTPDVVAVQFGNVDAVYGAAGAAVEPGGAADAVKVISLNPDLAILGESPSRMSGLDGFTIEVENAAAGDVPVLRVPAGPLAISPGRRLWASFFDTPNGLLAVMVGGSVARWEDSLAAAEPVLESIQIGDEGG
jgi:hypothetical protein